MTDPPPDRLTELRVSARGWHGFQLAVIGFIGLCGVLQGGRPDNPWWLQTLAGVLAIVALVLACAATYLVARVAWPLYGARYPADDAVALERDGRRLKAGLVLTFAALAVLALGTASGWWPQEDGDTGADALVAVETTGGQRACGTLGDGGAGTLSLTVDGRAVTVPLENVATVTGVGNC